MRGLIFTVKLTDQIQQIFTNMKSNRLLRLIILLMGLMWWGTLCAAETKFVSSDIKISWAQSEADAQNALSEAGYNVIDADLNDGAGQGSGFIYVGVKYTTDASDAITDILFWSDKSSNVPDVVHWNKKTYTKVTACFNSYDLNNNCGKNTDYIFMFVSKTDNTAENAKIVTEIKFRNTGRSTSSGEWDAPAFNKYEKQHGVYYVTNSWASADMNRNAGNDAKSDYIYCEVYKNHTHNFHHCTISSASKHNRCCACNLILSTENHETSSKGGKCSACGYEYTDGALCFTSKANNTMVSLKGADWVKLQ